MKIIIQTGHDADLILVTLLAAGAGLNEPEVTLMKENLSTDGRNVFAKMIESVMNARKLNLDEVHISLP